MPNRGLRRRRNSYSEEFLSVINEGGRGNVGAVVQAGIIIRRSIMSITDVEISPHKRLQDIDTNDLMTTPARPDPTIQRY